MDLAPAALVKLNANAMGDVSKLTKKRICAIFFRYFGTLYKEANPKPAPVSGLEGLMDAQPDLLATAGAPAAAALPLPVPPFPPAAAAAAAEVDSEEEYEDEGEDSE